MIKKVFLLMALIVGFSILTGCNGICRGNPDDCYGAADCWYTSHNCTSC